MRTGEVHIFYFSPNIVRLSVHEVGTAGHVARMGKTNTQVFGSS